MIKVLFAEDEAIMRAAIHKMVDWENSLFELTAVVANGAEALAFLNENPVDIVVTDLIMPVMTGIELIEKLKEQAFRGVILVLSNYTDFELVRTALTSGALDYMLKMNIDGETLLTQLEAAAKLLSNQKSPKNAGFKKEVRDAMDFIHANYTEKITLDDVAQAVNLNSSYLCRIFKKDTGGHMFQYLNDLRMQKAATLMEAGNTYVREVAEAVGMSDQFYFTRVFKKYHQVSPSEYAKRFK